MKRRLNNQRGSAQIIIISVLVVGLLGTLGFIFWQNFINKPVNDKNASSQTSQKKTSANSNDKPSLSQDVNFKTDANSTGVTLTKASDVDALQDINDDLKSFLKAELAQSQDSDGCYVVINLHRVYKQKYATGNQGVGGEGCGGGFAALWAQSKGSWKRVIGAQQAPMCDAIEKLIKDDGLVLEDLEVVGWDICYADQNSMEAQHYKAVQQ